MAQSPLTTKMEEEWDPMAVDADDMDETTLKTSPSEESSVKDESVTPPPPSRSISPTKAKTGMTTNGTKKAGPILIADLPRAEADALQTFEELQGNHYQYSTLGRSREELESMTCDCQFVAGEDDPSVACGDSSDCINRLTQVECMEDDCRCRSHCQNQRMQRRQHADLEIVLTEKKGFGLRAGSVIEKDAFIYEYIGDVVSQPSFAKRMRDYAAEGVRHFYFMMLQKDEFIDATKRGGIGRFANHSCNPNCYVSKWTVGNHVRMGIFSKRRIQKDEEITFNYNVDRYGHDAQPCYCGEEKCVGVLGGKTQTDVAAMDDLYLDALGISDEVEMFGLKGNKKKKSKKLDEDYVPILKPLSEKDVPKVVQAIRQTQSKKVLSKLLSRLKMTADQSALRQLMRLRGFSLMSNILTDFTDDLEVCTLALECVSTWPLLQRNKIEDSKIEEPVQRLQQSENEGIRLLSEKVLAQWAALEIGYRIPKRVKGDGVVRGVIIDLFHDSRNFEAKRRREVSRSPPRITTTTTTKSAQQVEKEMAAFKERVLREKTPEEKPIEIPAHLIRPKVPVETPSFKKPTSQETDDLIESLRVKAAERQAAAEAELKAAMEAAKKASTSEKDKARKKPLSEEEKEALKEKKLQKLVGAIVVKCLSKHKDQMGHDEFKQHAKEITQLISDKEKKSQSYLSGKLESLSEDKTAKIKKFAKEYIAKLLRRLEKQNVSGHASTSTPRSDTAPPGVEAHPQDSANGVSDEEDPFHWRPKRSNGAGHRMLVNDEYKHSKPSRWDERPSLTRDPRNRFSRRDSHAPSRPPSVRDRPYSGL